MLVPPTPHPGFARWTNLFSILVIGIASAAIVGWIFDVSLLKRIVTGSIMMKFNVALLFLLAGLSLQGAAVSRAPLYRQIAKSCVGIILLVAALTFTEHVFGWDFHIDNLMIREQAAATAKYAPGRMSLQTSVCFLLFGMAFLVSSMGKIGWPFETSRALLVCAVFIALASLVGHVYGLMFQVSTSQITGMAIHTSFGFLLLCAGLFCARLETGMAGVLLSDTTGGIMARRLLPVAVLLPLLIGWLRVSGEQAGLYGTPAGAAFFIVCTLVFFSVLVISTARQLHALDTARRAAVVMRDRTIADLQQALDEVRTLQGLLPMCAWCKKIRDDQGYWDDVASYIAKHTGASVSHGICPECAKEHFTVAKPG